MKNVPNGKVQVNLVFDVETKHKLDQICEKTNLSQSKFFSSLINSHMDNPNVLQFTVDTELKQKFETFCSTVKLPPDEVIKSILMSVID